MLEEGHVHVGGHHHKVEVTVLDSSDDAAALFGIALVELSTEVVEELSEFFICIWFIYLPLDDGLVVYPLDGHNLATLHDDEGLMLVVTVESHVFVEDLFARHDA